MGPGRIDLGNRGSLVVGEMTPGLTPRVQAIAHLLQHFDPRAHAVADIWPYKWGKLAYGSLLFATALAPETMAETLADPEHRALLVERPFRRLQPILSGTQRRQRSPARQETARVRVHRRQLLVHALFISFTERSYH